LEPLVLARGWTEEQIFDPTLQMDDSVTTKMAGTYVDRITIFTHGTVTGDYLGAVQQTAKRLGGLAMPASFDLCFPEAIDPMDRHLTIWYGTDDEIQRAKQVAAIVSAQSTLLAAGVGGSTFAGLTAIGRLLGTTVVAKVPGTAESEISELSVLIATLAFMFGEPSIDIRDLNNQGVARSGRELLYGEAVTVAKQSGAKYAIRLPYTRGAWYCFDQAGKVLCHLVPQHIGLKYVRSGAAE